MAVVHLYAYFILEWEMHPNYCVSATNVDLPATYHSEGNAGVQACKSECKTISKCSAIEWYGNGEKCYLMLSDVPAAKGFSGPRYLDAECYIRPGNGKMTKRNVNL